MGMRKRSRRAPVIDERRHRIAELLLARPGISERAVARELGISRRTVQRDIEAIRAEWAARRLHAYESRLIDDLMRTERALEALWPAVESGKGWAIDRLCALIATRVKLLGLDTVRHELDIGELLAQYLVRREGDADGDAAA